MNYKIIIQMPHTYLKHLPKSVAFRLVSMKKYENKLTHTHTHTQRSGTAFGKSTELCNGSKAQCHTKPYNLFFALCLDLFFLSVKLQHCHTEPCYMGLAVSPSSSFLFYCHQLLT